LSASQVKEYHLGGDVLREILLIVLHNPRARTAFDWSMAGLLVLSLIPMFW
jgi:hypothetical protein